MGVVGGGGDYSTSDNSNGKSTLHGGETPGDECDFDDDDDDWDGDDDGAWEWQGATPPAGSASSASLSLAAPYPSVEVKEQPLAVCVDGIFIFLRLTRTLQRAVVAWI